MKKTLFTALLAFAPLSFFAIDTSLNAIDINQQNRLIFLEQVKNIIISTKEQIFSSIEISESASLLQKAFIEHHNNLTHPKEKHDALLLHIATDMYQNSRDAITTNIRNQCNHNAIKRFTYLNTLEHNKIWLDAVKNHGIHSIEAQEILEELIKELFIVPHYDDENDESYDNYISEDELKQLYPAYITFYKNHTGISPDKDDLDFDIESLLEFLSIPAAKDCLDQLLTQINTEIIKIKELEQT